jgi:hypothetical protein
MKTITIPERDELLARLTAIDDERPLRAFYPVLLYKLNDKLTGVDIANKLADAMDVYTADHPTPTTAAVRAMLHTFVPAFTDDPDVQAEALAHLKAAGIPVD